MICVSRSHIRSVGLHGCNVANNNGGGGANLTMGIMSFNLQSSEVRMRGEICVNQSFI